MTDAREFLHAKCDCVPDLGPAHCHLCSDEKGSSVPWPECSAVTEVAAKAWSEGWSARASRGYAHLKVGECVPPPAHINPYLEAAQP